MLRHVAKRAELVLVPGGTDASGGVLAPTPRQHLPLTHVDSTRLKHLPESLKRCAGPGLHQAEALARKPEEVRRPWKRAQEAKSSVECRCANSPQD